MSLVATILSVPISSVLAYIPHFSKVFVLRSSFDNTRPRDVDGAMKGVPKERAELAMRLHSAHANQLETLGIFGAAVATCVAVGAPLPRVTAASWTYVVARLAYNMAYAAPQIANGIPRTFTFVLSLSSMGWLWVEAIRTAAIVGTV